MKLPKAPRKHSLVPGVTLFFPRTLAATEPVITQYERFVDRYADELTHFWDQRTRRFRAYRPNCRQYGRDNAHEGASLGKWCSWTAYVAKDSLEPASQLFKAAFPSADSQNLYYAEWSDRDWQRILVESLELARATEVEHGLGGFVLWPIRAASHAMSHKHFALPFCMRYQGVDLATGGDTAASCHTTIKGVNW